MKFLASFQMIKLCILSKQVLIYFVNNFNVQRHLSLQFALENILISSKLTTFESKERRISSRP